jgi:hypothetical protein
MQWSGSAGCGDGAAVDTAALQQLGGMGAACVWCEAVLVVMWVLPQQWRSS